MKAVIVGATGLVGSELLKKLLSDSDFSQIIAVTRKPLSIQHEKLKEILIQDFANLSQHSNELKGTHYFCCLGTTLKSAGSRANFRKIDYDAVFDFATIAKHHNAEYFSFISASGANVSSFIFYNKVKGEIENALINLNLNKLVIFRPGLLIGNRKEFRAGEELALAGLKIINRFIFSSVTKRVTTNVDTLATRVLKEIYTADRGLKIIESRNI